LAVLTLDTLDVSGNHAPDLMRHIQKTRLDAKGQPYPHDKGEVLEPPPKQPFVITLPQHVQQRGGQPAAGGRRLLSTDPPAGGQGRPASALPQLMAGRCRRRRLNQRALPEAHR